MCYIEKNIHLSAIIILVTLALSGCTDSHQSNYKISKDKVTLNIAFLDKKWNGKTVPKEEVCSDYHEGGGESPALKIFNLPVQTNYVILSFSDDTFKGMRNGGHGVVGYRIEEGSSEVVVPSFKGESFSLPTGFESVVAHRGVKFGKKEGAYLPPCSGGRGNLYTLYVQAMLKSTDNRKSNLLLGDANITLGRY